MKRFAAAMLAAVAVFGVAGAGEAQRTRPSAVDRQFMKDAAEGGMKEVRLGRMAMRRAASDEVRAFGRRMVEDHSAANQQLMDLARSESVRLPAAPGPVHQADISRLSALSGRQFDRAYVAQMVVDHRKTVNLLSTEVRGGAHPEVRAFARNTLPTVREHLRHAVELSREAGGMPGGGRGGRGNH